MVAGMARQLIGVVVAALCLAGAACGSAGDTQPGEAAGSTAAAVSSPAEPAAGPAEAPKADAGRSRRLDGYTARIFKWSYYLVPQGLGRDDLLEEAAAIHAREPDAQLVLVDDESRVKDYIAHAKAVTEGRTDVELPQAWADEHVVANLQKMMSGRWMLYKGYGYEEIGEVK
jgi:hypothetical protein